MKLYFYLSIIVWLSTPFFSIAQLSLRDSPLLPPGIHTVLGVFEQEDNAVRFTRSAQAQALEAQYGYHPDRQYYYVYAHTSPSVAQAVEQCLQIRKNPTFQDAWVLNTVPDSTVADDGESSAERAYQVYFQVTGEDAQPVPAVVKVMREDGAKLIKECVANQPERIEHARLTSPSVKVQLYAIGYQQAILDLSLDNSTSSETSPYVTLDETGIMQVTVPLQTLKKGDAQELINTYFYGNASVMRKKSRREMEALTEYLQKHPSVYIKLHGHTNGNQRGITYLYKPEAQNFFEIRRSKEFTKNEVGAVKLSEMRAETIKAYLVSEGIAANRIETKGWGGKKMLYEPESSQAKQNIRVEIEVLSE